jgi:hypothetical protein
MTEIEKAEQTLFTLQSKQRDLARNAVELADERQRISFAAHADEDAKARKRLDEITAATVAHQSEMASIEAAIAQANVNLDVAQHNAAIESDRAQAGQLLEELEVFQRCAEALDANLAAVVKNARTMADTLTEMNRLGAGPSRSQLDSLGGRAILTQMMLTPWARSFEHIAPNQRATFTTLVEDWSRLIRSNAVQRLGGAMPPKRNKKAA